MTPAIKVLLTLTLLYGSQLILANTNKEANIQVEIIDSFADMHTGPGRGYPVFHTVEQGDNIKLLKRKGHWYYAQSPSGTKGWIPSTQLARTMKSNGVPVYIPSSDRGDFLTSLWRVGFSTGQFEKSNDFSIFAGYQALSWLGAEIEYGEVFNSDSNTDYYSFNVLVEPYSKWKLTPYLLLGVGKMTFDEKQKDSNKALNNAPFNSYGIGLNYYIGFNFVLRSEYRWYSASANTNHDYDFNEWKLGFSTFF